MARYFKGKSIGYHTSITVTKKEEVVIWVLGLLCFICFIVNMIVFNSVLLIVLIDFLEFFVMFAVFMGIIFSSKHKEERIKNTVIR